MTKTLSLAALGQFAFICFASAAPAVDQQRPLEADGGLAVHSINGTAKIRLWDKSQVRLQATSDDGVKEVRFEKSGAGLVVHVEPYKDKSGGAADLVLSVPRTAEIQVHGVNLTVDVEAGSRLDVKTVNGPITATSSGRSVHLQTVNGRIDLKAKRIDATLKTVNGDITLTAVHLDRLAVDTVAGNLSVSAKAVERGEHRIKVHSGTVDLTLPSSVSIEGRTMMARQHFGSDDPKAPRIRVKSFTGNVQFTPSDAKPAD